VRGCFQIIGEATRSLSQSFRDIHPQVPWKKMMGMRHKIVHEYDHLRWEIIWDTMNTRIPELVTQLKPLVPPSSENHP
jgi:uncharacterized protein with HEPN domain